MENRQSNIRKIPFLFLLMLFSSLPLWAQQGIPVEGVILKRQQFNRYNIRFRRKIPTDGTQ